MVHQYKYKYKEEDGKDDDDEAEEALSLCDLPLNDHHSSDLPPRPSSPPSSSEFFEFLLSSSHMCPAEDIIFCGKLVPYKSPVKTQTKQSELKSPVCTEKSSLIMMTNSRSLGYQRSSPEVDKKPSQPSKPRWYLPMFGMVKLPSEMELRDIKSRQSRRNPPEDGSNSRAGKASWGLLRALSCKDHTSVSVTTPFGHMPRV